MKKSTINRLNQLNKSFYSQTANSFDQTRHFSWAGWENVWKSIEGQLSTQIQPKIIDLGCGNGRFYEFLAEKFNELSQEFVYFGIDSEKKLLQKAQEKISLPHQLVEADVLSISEKDYERAQMVVAFGLIHHIPSLDLRLRFFELCQNLCADNGLIIIAAWQFADDLRFSQRYVNPTEVGIEPDDLEDNDYILDWRQDVLAYRYCHHLTAGEAEYLAKKTNLKIVKSFKSDGKSRKLNQYYILKKMSKQ